MPSINRVRIINFSYNNDARHIMDETFDFHGGENALLNLANGGGKSVLVQLMLQPVVPRAKIQNRSIAEFFKKKKTPAYILLEWKLDEQGGYLLTGIALAPVESRSAEDEEKGRIRLFCFLSRYSQSNGYDLSHIQLVRHEDGMIHITPYKQAQEMMQEASRRDPLNCSYFPQDELENHRRKLTQFGISQDEWKHIMVRINDSEGGLEEIFSKCKTSDQLLNDWLIRTIEKGLAPSTQNNFGNDKELQQMFGNLLSETINSEEFLKEKQILSDFTPGFEDVKNIAASVAAVVDAKGETESELSAMHNALGEKGKATLGQLDEIDAALENLTAKALHVDQEEYSDRFYQSSEKYEQAHQENLSAQLDKEQADKRLIQAKEKLSMMRGAGLKDEIDANQARIAALKAQISLISENTEITAQINQLKASLLRSWEQRLETTTGEKGSLEAELNQLRALQNSQKEQQKELSSQMKCLRLEGSELQKNITIFESDESRLCRDLGIELTRNLIRALSEKDIVRIRTTLEKQITESDQRLKNLCIERENHESRVCSLNREYDDASSNQSEQSNLLKDIQLKLEEYDRLTDEFKQVLASNGLSPRDEKSVFLAQLEKSQVELHSRVSQSERELHNLLALTEDLRSGRYHIQGEWIDYLVDANISYQTGEDYLRGINGSDRDRLLHNMPLLPYSIILTPEDLSRLPESLDERVQRSIIPFITYDVLREVIAKETAPEATAAWNGRALISSTKTGPNFLLAALFNKDALDPKTAQTLADKIINRSDSHKASLENLREAEKKLSKDIFIINAYPYEPGWETFHLQQKQQLQNVIQQLENCKETVKQKISACEARLKELTEAIPKVENEFSRHQEHLSRWNDHIHKNTEFERSCLKLADNQQSSANAEKKETALQNEIASLLSEKIPHARQAIANKEKELLECKNKFILYEGSILPEGLDHLGDSITAMEASLKTLIDNQGKELSELEQTLKDCSDELKKRNKNFEKLRLPADVVLPAFSEMVEEELEHQEALASKGRERYIERTGETGKNEAVTRDRLARARRDLEQKGLTEPLPETDIFRDYNNRRNGLKNDQRQFSEQKKHLETEMLHLKQALEKIADVMNLQGTKPSSVFTLQDDWQKQLSQQLSDLKSSKEDISNKKEQFSRSYNNLRSDFSQRSSLLLNLFQGLDAMLDRASDGYEPFYYLYERMSDHAGILAQQLSMLNTRLESLDRSRSDVVQHCWFHGSKIHDELRRIEQRSAVHLEGRSSATNMLRIGMELDSPDVAKVRMQAYIEKSVQEVREEFRSGKSTREIQSAINKLIQSRELLNTYLGTTRIPVYVFKIDINMINSRPKIWEDAVRENSGGEKFVIYFSVLSALMAYSRAQEQAVRSSVGEDMTKSGTRVLIMDNPFGPISSQHLLKPLFDIAKRYRTQLICLTDLKQSSILNNFNLVYMLKVRKGAASSKEYLKFDEFKRSTDLGDKDEALEKAFFRVSDFQQMNLWD